MRVLTDGNAAWGLPPTCSDEERLMQSQRIDSAPDRGLVAILADNESTAGGLVEACRLAGYATVTLDACNGLPAAVGHFLVVPFVAGSGRQQSAVGTGRGGHRLTVLSPSARTAIADPCRCRGGRLQAVPAG